MRHSAQNLSRGRWADGHVTQLHEELEKKLIERRLTQAMVLGRHGERERCDYGKLRVRPLCGVVQRVRIFPVIE